MHGPLGGRRPVDETTHPQRPGDRIPRSGPAVRLYQLVRFRGGQQDSYGRETWRPRRRLFNRGKWRSAWVRKAFRPAPVPFPLLALIRFLSLVARTFYSRIEVAVSW